MFSIEVVAYYNIKWCYVKVSGFYKYYSSKFFLVLWGLLVFSSETVNSFTGYSFDLSLWFYFTKRARTTRVYHLFYLSSNKIKSIKKKGFYSRSYSSLIKDNLDLIKTDRKNIKIIWLDFKIFEGDQQDIFISKLYFSDVLIKNTQYIVLIKIRKGDIYYIIAEKQYFFSFSNKEDPAFFKLFQYTVVRLSRIFLEYSSELNYKCDGVILEFYNVVIDNRLKISNTNNLKGIINTPEIREINKNLLDTTEIVQHTKKIKFNSILTGYSLPSKSDWLANIKIGSFDLKTYNKEGIPYCYAVGYHSSIQNKPSIYYINKKTLDSNKLIVDCLKQMLTNIKLNNFIFYVHNFGKLGAPFIIKALSLYNTSDDSEVIKNPFKFEEVKTRNSDVLSLKVTCYMNNSKEPNKIIFKDSMAILPFSLRDLGRNFEIKETKGYFPYVFCNEKTLFYSGKTPDIEFYKGISSKEYKKLYKEAWSLKDECFYYLEKDLLCLYKIMIKANKTLHSLFSIDITNFSTIFDISMHIFLNKYYDNVSLPLITHSTTWKNIYNAYYGSRVEVYNPIITSKAYYYDVNSLYLFASLNDLPGTECEYTEYIKTKPNLDNLFGFFYCKVKSKDNYLGLLPVKSESSLIFPIGEWEGWYFSEELKFAQENGYKLDIVRGYNFTKKASNIFKDFVDDISKIKTNPKTNTERTFAKLILNNLIEGFGRNFLKTKAEIINKEKLNILITTRQVQNIVEITDNCFLTIYFPK